MAATMTPPPPLRLTRRGRVLLTLLTLLALATLLLTAFAVGQRHCQATQAAHPVAADTRVNGAC